MYYEVNLKWITPDADKMIGHMARVSNPKAKPDAPSAGLIRYLIQNRHWSPFEMANMCVEIKTTRDIGRQILRHRSFSFQEFSQRYADVAELLPDAMEFRLQDHTNKQNSFEVDQARFLDEQAHVEGFCKDVMDFYQELRSKGIAKEVARKILPEGLTPTHMYMNGTIRSWIHYCNERCEDGVQAEHRIIAHTVKNIIIVQLPDVGKAVWPEVYK